MGFKRNDIKSSVTPWCHLKKKMFLNSISIILVFSFKVYLQIQNIAFNFQVHCQIYLTLTEPILCIEMYLFQ